MNEPRPFALTERETIREGRESVASPFPSLTAERTRGSSFSSCVCSRWGTLLAFLLDGLLQ